MMSSLLSLIVWSSTLLFHFIVVLAVAMTDIIFSLVSLILLILSIILNLSFRAVFVSVALAFEHCSVFATSVDPSLAENRFRLIALRVFSIEFHLILFNLDETYLHFDETALRSLIV